MKSLSRLLLVSVLVTSLPGAPGRGQSQAPEAVASAADPAQFENLLERVGQRIQKYHDDMLSISWTERIRHQGLRSDMTLKDKPKDFVFQAIVVRRPSPVDERDFYFVATRDLKSIDGKPSKEKKISNPKCGDPHSTYGSHLSFLLPKQQARFVFSDEGEVDLRGRRTAVVAFVPSASSKSVGVTKQGNCFSVYGGQSKGKAWIDLQTYDVLQTQWQLAEPFEVETPKGFVRFGILPVFSPSRKLSYEKSETTTRFRQVTFQNPEQTLLLPVSSENVRLIKGFRTPGFRSTISYTDYKRFLTSVEVKDTDNEMD